jgi:hypothetical protein
MVSDFAARVVPEAHAKGSDPEDQDGLVAPHLEALGRSDHSAGI